MEPLQPDPSAAAAAAAAEGWPAADLEAKVDVLMLLRMRDQMKQQLMECSTAVRASQESCHDHVIEENFIKNATQDLERDVEEVKVSFQNKTLALQRMQLMFALRNKMKQNDNDSRLIVETMKRIVLLSQAVIESQQQAREKEQKLIDIKRKRLSLKKAGRQKLLQIHTMMKKQKEEQASMEVTEMLEKIRNNLQKERAMTTVIQNVFQNIIIGSRINWAEDPSLKAIVLQLEKNVCLL
ncbi:centromere protein H [Gavia stellata]|uniref:centromere protein H n=1 Tax=Gavia stellata TaxID=37040 RepID=UPI00289C179A|nr:centromere protein H [Gavia stellata]